MSIVSARFVLLVAVSIILIHGCHSHAAKRCVLLFASAWFVASQAASVPMLMPLLGFLLAGFLLIRWTQFQQRRLSILFSISLVLFLFLYLKKYTFLKIMLSSLAKFFNGSHSERFSPFIEQTYMTVGLSYVMFRLIHIIVDVYGGAIKKPISMISYLNYVCFFPNYISGPIQRFQDYTQQEDGLGSKALRWEDFKMTIPKIINGYLKVILVAPCLIYLHTKLPFQVNSPAVAYEDFWLVFAFLSYTLYLYYNFSGYMEIVISVGYLLGFELPANFNRPFSAKNFIEFWSRWHITLSEWFRTYLFNPLLKAASNRWRSISAAPYLGVAAFFVTFFVMGIWHGSTIVFAIYGLFLGLGISLNKLYQVFAKKWLGKKRYSGLKQKWFYSMLCTGFTFSYFSMALVVMWPKNEWLQRYMNVAGAGSFLRTFILLGIIASVSLALVARMREQVTGVVHSVVLPVSCRRIVAHSWLLGRLILLVLAILSSTGETTSIPQFVYEAF